MKRYVAPFLGRLEDGDVRGSGQIRSWHADLTKRRTEAFRGLEKACGESSDPAVRAALVYWQMLASLVQDLQGASTEGVDTYESGGD